MKIVQINRDFNRLAAEENDPQHAQAFADTVGDIYYHKDARRYLTIWNKSKSQTIAWLIGATVGVGKEDRAQCHLYVRQNDLHAILYRDFSFHLDQTVRNKKNYVKIFDFIDHKAFEAYDAAHPVHELLRLFKLRFGADHIFYRLLKKIKRYE